MSAALDRVTELCRRHGKFVVTTVGDRQERAYSEMLIGRGVQGLVFATDALVFLKACQRMVANLK
jgi:DNA-binding LacI/PurR family transcriptional regulator